MILYSVYLHSLKQTLKNISFQDKRGTIKTIAEFLGRSLTEYDVDRIVEHTSLQYMKTNDKVNLSYIEKYRETDKSEGAFINKGNGFLFPYCHI